MSTQSALQSVARVPEKVQATVKGTRPKASRLGLLVKGPEPLEWRIVAAIEVAYDFYDITRSNAGDAPRRLVGVQRTELLF
jgi:hypothetical protein